MLYFTKLSSHFFYTLAASLVICTVITVSPIRAMDDSTIDNAKKVFHFKGKTLQPLGTTSRKDLNEELAKIIRETPNNTATCSLHSIIDDKFKNPENIQGKAFMKLIMDFSNLYVNNQNPSRLDTYFKEASPEFFNVKTTDRTIVTLTSLYYFYNRVVATAVLTHLHNAPAFLTTLDDCIEGNFLNTKRIRSLSAIERLSAKYLLLYPNEFLEEVTPQTTLNILSPLAKQLDTFFLGNTSTKSEEGLRALATLCLCINENRILPHDVENVLIDNFVHYNNTKSTTENTKYDTTNNTTSEKKE